MRLRIDIMGKNQSNLKALAVALDKSTSIQFFLEISEYSKCLNPHLYLVIMFLHV